MRGYSILFYSVLKVNPSRIYLVQLQKQTFNMFKVLKQINGTD